VKETGSIITSPGGSFNYVIKGPVCILFDRNELPWPSCSLNWKGKQPSWNRVGKRFVPDLAASRCHAYSVHGSDLWGNSWEQVLIIYNYRLSTEEKLWWYWKGPSNKTPPESP